MRVAMVSPFDPAPPAAHEAGRAHVGGVERVLQRMAAELARLGHEVTLVCSASRAAPPAAEEGVTVLRVRRRATVMRAPLARLHAALPADAELVHVPATYPFTTPSVLRAARRRGQPCILDFHFEPHPGSPAGQAAARAYRALGPRAYALAERVLVRSTSYALHAPSLRRVPAARWRVVPNGVDAERFRPGPAPARGDLLVVGRLVPYKGVGTLLRALSLLPGAPPLTVAGDGPLRPQLQALAARLGVRARFLGRVPDEALPGLYRGAALTVLPSVNPQEAFGIALVESMACGTPVVASGLPGVEEVAAEGGFLARPGDPASLAAALLRALEPGALPRGPALAARIHARYAWPVVARQLADAYEEALGGAPARGAREVEPPAHPVGHPLL